MTPEEAAALQAEQERQIRELASQIAQMTKLGFDPMTIRKGVVAGVADTTTPPTVSINISGDSNTLVSQVRTLNNYTPLVGQTVLIGKQGTEIFLLGSIASVNPRTAVASSAEDNGWIKATLSNGSHEGGDNDVYYRRIMDHGSWKMQWRGVWNPGGDTHMIESADALDPDYRPAGFRAVAAARDANGLAIIRLEFSVDGTVRWWQASPEINLTGDLGGSTSVELIGYKSLAGTDLGHSHGLDTGSHSHGGFTVIDSPSWISLNGVEYFL